MIRRYGDILSLGGGVRYPILTLTAFTRIDVALWFVWVLCVSFVLVGTSVQAGGEPQQGGSEEERSSEQGAASSESEPEEADSNGKTEEGADSDVAEGEEEAVLRGRLDAKAGDDVIVVLADGQRLEGVLVSRTQQEVVVRISGVEARLQAGTVERVILLDSPEQRYRQMRSMIGNEDVPRLIMLADWLQRRRMYTEALREIEHVLSVNPTEGEALRMHKVLQELVRLQKANEGRGAVVPAEDQGDQWKREIPRRPKTAEFPLLREDQINLMKVYEVDTKAAPRLVIARPVIDRLLNEYADSPLIPSTREGREAFYRKRPAEVLEVMFSVRARNLYEHVQVLDQPRSMRLFRDNVHAAWLINTCATTRCHGGSGSGRLRLTNHRPNSDEALYTNFLILERFVTKDGKRLINYAEPEKSVLLQMGLPRDDALYPHPLVEGWRPAFRSREARRFRDGVEWIRSMYRPRPEYPILYTPPGEAESDWIPGDPGQEPQPR